MLKGMGGMPPGGLAGAMNSPQVTMELNSSYYILWVMVNSILSLPFNTSHRPP